MKKKPMPESVKFIDGKKFMWDGKIYESRDRAEEAAIAYGKDAFSVCILAEAGTYLIYNRRETDQKITSGGR